MVNWRRSSAYASRVRPRNPARNPARASRSGSVKAGWIVASAVDGAAVVIGHLPAGLEPGKAGPVPVPAFKRKPNIGCLVRGHATPQTSECRNPAGQVRNAPDLSTRRARRSWQAGRSRRPDYPVGAAGVSPAAAGAGAPIGSSWRWDPLGLAVWPGRSAGPVCLDAGHRTACLRGSAARRAAPASFVADVGFAQGHAGMGVFARRTMTAVGGRPPARGRDGGGPGGGRQRGCWSARGRSAVK